MSRTIKIPIDKVKSTGRRKNLGDIEALAKNIDTVGQLRPITLTNTGLLLLGERRYAAVKLLGLDSIRAIIARDIEDVLTQLSDETHEDTIEVEPLVISDRTRLCELLERFHEPVALAIRNERLRSMRGNPPPEAITRPYPGIRHKITKAMAWNSTSYGRAKHVLKAAKSTEPAIAQVAEQAIVDMDATGRINIAYEKVRALTKEQERFRLPSFIGMYRSESMTGERFQRFALQAAIPDLLGSTGGLDQIETFDENITPAEAAQWVGGLAEARRRIERTINRLRRQVIAKEETT